MPEMYITDQEYREYLVSLMSDLQVLLTEPQKDETLIRAMHRALTSIETGALPSRKTVATIHSWARLVRGKMIEQVELPLLPKPLLSEITPTEVIQPKIRKAKIIGSKGEP